MPPSGMGMHVFSCEDEGAIQLLRVVYDWLLQTFV